MLTGTVRSGTVGDRDALEGTDTMEEAGDDKTSVLGSGHDDAIAPGAPAPTDTEEPGATDAPFVPVEHPPVGLIGDDMAPWTIDAAILPDICYALAHNRQPVIHSLSVSGLRPTESTHLTVEITSLWARNGRPPIAPTKFSIEAPQPGQRVELSPVSGVKLDDIALAELEAPCPTHIIVRVSDGAGRTAELEKETVVHARTQWLSDPRHSAVTAAFVQPNHPHVAGILQGASRRLAEAGLEPAISGYQQSSSGQHHRIAQAIFEELQSRIDHYINPPATYATLGQMVRPLDEVLANRHGTCIDLACAYAACLEQAGLHPLVYLVEGHAFAGYINVEEHLPREVVDTWPEIQNDLDSNRLVGVETVELTRSTSFWDAVASTREHFDEDHMEAIVDVALCHRSGIRPLPAQIRQGDELIVVIDNGPAEPVVIERRDPATRRLLPNTVPARVQSWKNRLLDLSFRNRLLNLKLDRAGLLLLPPLDKLGQIEDRLAGGGPLHIAPADMLNAVQLESIPLGKERTAQNVAAEVRHEMLALLHTVFTTSTTENFKRRVSRMRSDARVAEEESGANNLFLALGAVRWGDLYGDFHSPVFLVPLRMRMGRADQVLQITMDDTQSTVPNYCLIEALRARESLSLQWFSDDMTDEAGLDIDRGLQVLRDEFRERGLDRRGFRVELSASIAMLDFKKFRLWKDLDEHWEKFAERPVVRHLIESPRATFVDPAFDGGDLAIDDTSLLTPQPADGSQLRAIGRALAGQSFVLEGPPGTGKSQTITNLLANAMHRGKRVLFVAEKQAALSVVRERLEQVGLGPYCLELHDRGTKPEALRTQLREALEQQPAFDERTFEQFEQDFAALARQLDQYRHGLYAPNDAGYSFAGAFDALSALGPGPTATVPRHLLQAGPEAGADARSRMVEMETYTGPARVAVRHPWALAGPIEFDGIDRAALSHRLLECTEFASGLAGSSGPAADLVTAAVDIDELEGIASLLSVIEGGTTPAPSEWAAIGISPWPETIAREVDRARAAIAAAAPVVQGRTDLLGRSDLDTVARATKEAAGSFVLGRKGRIKEALGDLVAVLGEGKIDPEQACRAIETLAKSSNELRLARGALATLPGVAGLVADIPSAEQLDALTDRAAHLTAAASLVRATGPAADAARAILGGTPLLPPGTGGRVGELCASLRAATVLLGSGPELQRRWSGSDGVVATIVEVSGPAWREAIEGGTFLGLQRWLALQRHLEPLRAIGLTDLCRELETGALQASEAGRAYDRGTLTMTMTVRAEEMNLDVFDREAHDRRVLRFIELLGQRRELAKAAIPYGLQRSRRVQSGVATGRVGDFRREVSRPGRGRGKSIRHLIATYPEIVSDLTPCFLMSPDSVAQFLPPGTVDFDLVVFDEASQILVPDSIGSLGRAKAVVVVGDSRQMPPTKVGVFSGENDEDTNPGVEADYVDEDSILEETLQAGFDQEWLSWHYRSQDESLISFSNTNYYEQRLATFPAPTDARPDCGVFYRRVDGQFDHGSSRTNAIEAAAVVEEVVRRLDDPATAALTYGIITLNLQQRHLVESLLDESPHPLVRELRETEDPDRRLFVLNLENVQGRERDVIVMGTSFSKRASGGAMPLNFGPLTTQGGEKRLNVAVTRARRQFVVVSSFDPADMRDPSSLGMIHLKDYLTRAASGTHAGDSSGGRDTGETARHLDDLARRLEDRGIRVSRNRGLSTFKVDLALALPEQPDRWLVAVLLDGHEWSKRPLVVDRDALPTSILRDVMGWPRVARLWLPAWRLEPDDIVESLVELVHAAAQAPNPEPVPVPVPVPVPETVAAPAPPAAQQPLVLAAHPGEPSPVPSGRLPGEEPFVRHPDGPEIGDLAQLEQVVPAVHAVVKAIVEQEGPLPVESALKRTAAAFGLRRVHAARIRALLPVIEGFTITESAFGSFVWPPSRAPESWAGFRRPGADSRPVAEVAPEEIANLMVAITRQSIGISRPQLVRACAEFFGVGMLRTTTANHLDAVISWAVGSGRLVEHGETLTVPG